MGVGVILLDTNVLIDIDNFEFDPGEVHAASVLSRAELEFGVRRAPRVADREARRARLAQLDGRFAWLLFDLAASRGYGTVAAGAAGTGVRLRGKDALLAGQAYSLGCAIMTSNTADFAPFRKMVTIVEPTPR